MRRQASPDSANPPIRLAQQLLHWPDMNQTVLVGRTHLDAGALAKHG
jgi:hypothetical protein